MSEFKRNDRNDRFGGKRPGGPAGRSRGPAGRTGGRFGPKKDFGGRPSFGGSKFSSHGGKPPYKRFGGGSGGEFPRPPAQMHQATCAQCGKACEVPFRPDGQRPIYCNDCFGNPKSAGPGHFPKPVFQNNPVKHQPQSHPQFQPKPQSQAVDPRIEDIKKQLAKVELKLDQILLAMTAAKSEPVVEKLAKPAAKAKKKPAKKK